MIEQGIYFALGCIVTALGALMFAPVFWSRAMRLSRKRLQLQIPMSMQEVQAERDALRAEFAVDRLRIEQALQRVQDTQAADMAEIGRRSAEAARLAEELAATKAELAARRDGLEAATGDLASLREAHGVLQTVAAAAATEVAALRTDVGAERSNGNALRAELVARHAEVVTVQAQLDAAKADRRESQDAIHEMRTRHEAEITPLRGEAARVAAAISAEAGRLQALEEELAAARDREKSLHLQSSLQNGAKAEKDRAAAERMEQLERENATMQAALVELRGTPSPAGDASLRESIHALGLAVAAMSRDEGATREEQRPLPATGERDAVG